MKLFFKFFVIITAIAFSMNSCQKEFTIEDDFNPPTDSTDNTDSIYIDRVFYFEETAAGLDTMWGYYFKYDDSKRVTEVYYNEDFPVNSYELEHKYYYHGSDTIPYKTEEFDGASDNFPTETFFTFDSQQRIIKDSIRHYNNSGV